MRDANSSTGKTIVSNGRYMEKSAGEDWHLRPPFAFQGFIPQAETAPFNPGCHHENIDNNKEPREKGLPLIPFLGCLKHPWKGASKHDETKSIAHEQWSENLSFYHRCQKQYRKHHLAGVTGWAKRENGHDDQTF